MEGKTSIIDDNDFMFIEMRSFHCWTTIGQKRGQGREQNKSKPNKRLPTEFCLPSNTKSHTHIALDELSSHLKSSF